MKKDRVIEVGDVVVMNSGSDRMVVTAVMQGASPKPGYEKVDTLQLAVWLGNTTNDIVKFVVLPSSCVRLYDQEADEAKQD